MQKKINLSIATALLVATNSYAQISEDLGMITVTGGNFTTKENKTPFATEIFTQDEIKNSKAGTIYEFLNEQSSINVMPSSGNIYAQKLDMRGFGITDGYQNIVVIVDGQRMNNIDMTTQLLSAIPLDTIEQIEIIKGSGSVKFGDGATAGVINITTNGKYNNKLTMFSGSNDTKGASLLLGYNTDTMIINALWDDSSTDGNRKIDTNGDTDNKSQTISKLELKVFPTDDLEVRVTTSQTDIKNKYANGMTKASFDSDPSGLGTADWASKYYSENETEINNNSFGATYYFNNKNKILFDTINEDKTSDFITWKSDYETSQKNLQYSFETDSFKIALGGNVVNSERNSAGTGWSSSMSKDNTGYFANSEISINEKVAVNFGARKEKVEYKNIKENLDYDENLEAFELGYNQVLNENSSFFVNYNKAFQAPDIDRFYDENGNYSFSVLVPATSKTINLGLNDFRDNNKLKITLFKNELENEIYLIPNTWKNSNIDKSSKYGLELFDRYKINETFFTSLNYNYVIAKINSETAENVIYNNKTMPGVSKHNATINFGGNYEKTSFVLSHKYKSESYNSEDFSNSATQKQKAYNSTNLAFNYKLEKNLEFYTKINNLFEVKNGMWVRDDQIFPFDFERTFIVGINATF
jgi:iron complex outermembrane receptor protein